MNGKKSRRSPPVGNIDDSSALRELALVACCSTDVAFSLVACYLRTVHFGCTKPCYSTNTRIALRLEIRACAAQLVAQEDADADAGHTQFCK